MHIPRRNSIARNDLEAHEKRAAMMRAAGASLEDIALLMGTSTTEVHYILNRPRVLRYLAIIEGTIAEDIKPVVATVKQQIASTAEEALGTLVKNMRDLDEMGDALADPKHAIRAKLGASFNARDILDRAGERAPTRVVSTNLNATLPPEVLQRLESVLKEIPVEQGGKAIECEPLED